MQRDRRPSTIDHLRQISGDIFCDAIDEIDGIVSAAVTLIDDDDPDAAVRLRARVFRRIADEYAKKARDCEKRVQAPRSTAGDDAA